MTKINIHRITLATSLLLIRGAIAGTLLIVRGAAADGITPIKSLVLTTNANGGGFAFTNVAVVATSLAVGSLTNVEEAVTTAQVQVADLTQRVAQAESDQMTNAANVVAAVTNQWPNLDTDSTDDATQYTDPMATNAVLTAWADLDTDSTDDVTTSGGGVLSNDLYVGVCYAHTDPFYQSWYIYFLTAAAELHTNILFASHRMDGNDELMWKPHGALGSQRVFTDNNDGAGSLLDADKLDGLDSSAFVTNRFTPAEALSAVTNQWPDLDTDSTDDVTVEADPLSLHTATGGSVTGDVKVVGRFASGNSALGAGPDSHAEGVGTVASGTSAHSEGYNTTASGSYSHAQGDTTTASGDGAHAEGYHTIASGQASHAEGMDTTASGYASHAAGYRARATNDISYVWSDDSVEQYSPTTKTYTVRASNGIYLYGPIRPAGELAISRTNSWVDAVGVTQELRYVSGLLTGWYTNGVAL
jgi:hypothetical protein